MEFIARILGLRYHDGSGAPAYQPEYLEIIQALFAYQSVEFPATRFGVLSWAPGDAELSQAFVRALREENAGTSAGELLEVWAGHTAHGRAIDIYTAAQRKDLCRIMQRWRDNAALSKEFYFLCKDREWLMHRSEFIYDSMDEVRLGMRKWLESREKKGF
jgi:hypothetical protein